MLKESSSKKPSLSKLLLSSVLLITEAHAAMDSVGTFGTARQRKLSTTEDIQPNSSNNKGQLPFNPLITKEHHSNSFDELVWSTPKKDLKEYGHSQGLSLENPELFDSSVWKKPEEKNAAQGLKNDFDKQAWSSSKNTLTRLRKDVTSDRSLLTETRKLDSRDTLHVVAPRGNPGHHRDHNGDYYYSKRYKKQGKGKGGKKGKKGGYQTYHMQHEKPKSDNSFSMSMSATYNDDDDYDYVADYDYYDTQDDDHGGSELNQHHDYVMHDDRYSMSYSMSYSMCHGSYCSGNDDYDYSSYKPITLTCPKFNEIDNDRINEELLLWHYAIEHENGDVMEIIHSVEKEITKLVFGEINDCDDLRRARELYGIRVEGRSERALQDSGVKVIGASSAPEDDISGDTCDPTINNAECLVINGQMRLYVAFLARRRLSYSIEALDIIKDACNGGDLVSSPNTPNEFKKCRYLDDNRSTGTQVLIQESDDESLPLAMMFATAGAAAALLLLLLLAVRRRRNNRDDAYSYSMKDDETNETDTSETTKKRIAHVLVDESDQLPDLNRNLDDIPEDDMVVYEEPKYGNLGGLHSALNVHRCTSGTCAECARANKINFISTPSDRFDRDEMGEI